MRRKNRRKKKGIEGEKTRKDPYARLFAYLWMAFILYYLIKRLMITFVTYNLPFFANIVYNFSMMITWFGILNTPSILLLVIIEAEEMHKDETKFYTRTVFFIFLMIFLIAIRFYFNI